MQSQNGGTETSLSVADAARRLGITEDEVLRLVASKELAADIRITPSDVDRLLEKYRKSGVVNEYTPSEVRRTD